MSELVESSVQEALDGVLRMRRQEGDALRADMQKNLACVEENAGRIRELSVNLAAGASAEAARSPQSASIAGEMDPQRLAQEAALIADKSDISEEIARLKSHIEQYRLLMDAKEKAGKKLDFLLQELQREANTILVQVRGSGNIALRHRHQDGYRKASRAGSER